MTVPRDIQALIGFAQKCNGLLSGESQVHYGMKKKRIHLLIMAQDSPEKRKKHMQNRCDLLGIEFVMLGSKSEIGDILGSSQRSVIAITNKELADGILKKINKLELHEAE